MLINGDLCLKYILIGLWGAQYFFGKFNELLSPHCRRPQTHHTPAVARNIQIAADAAGAHFHVAQAVAAQFGIVMLAPAFAVVANRHVEVGEDFVAQTSCLLAPPRRGKSALRFIRHKLPVYSRRQKR